jgi:dienelactone hydrolase
VIISVNGRRLQGDLTVPAQSVGLVLFAHGSGSSRSSPRNRYVARLLQEHGCATLLFDLLTEAEAADRSLVFDINLLAGRLRAATAWIGTQGDVAGLPIGYFGASTGAAAALVAAAQEPAVHAVVSRGGRPDLAGSSLPHVLCPTLLIVGGADFGVIELNEDALRQLGGPKRLEIVPRASHLFEERGALEQVAALAAAWFAEHLPEV